MVGERAEMEPYFYDVFDTSITRAGDKYVELRKEENYTFRDLKVPTDELDEGSTYKSWRVLFDWFYPQVWEVEILKK